MRRTDPTMPIPVRASRAARPLAAATLLFATLFTTTPSAQPRGAAPDASRELTADQQVRHALSRLTFGARPGDVERVRAVGVDRWIAAQLQPERIDDRPLAATLATFETLGKSGDELLRAYPPPGVLLARQRMTVTTGEDSARVRKAARQSYQFVGELQASRLARAVASERQLEEVMVDFWENHFNVFAGKDRARYHLPEYDATIRRHALGSFRELLGAVAKSPAMLVYLDNWQSVADSTRPTLARGAPRGGARARLARRPAALPALGDTSGDTAALERRPQQLRQRRPRGLNENYARELLELHTLGVDGGYTQQDVVEVARALTGWTLNPPALGGGFVFRAATHDAGAKTVLGRALAAGRGLEDGEDVLDLVARHPATARHVARKLAVRFVSDSPPPALVERAAATFARTGGDIRETVRAVVTSPEFFSRAAYRAKVKSPFELVASALRALGAAPDSTPRAAVLVGRLGQPLFGHQAPDGWPETGAEWMNTGAILNRINFGLAVAAGRVPNAHVDAWPDAARLAPLDRAAQVDGVVAALFGGEVSKETRQVLLSGENPLAGDAAMAGATDGAASRRRDRAATSEARAARESVKPGRQRPAFTGQLRPSSALAGVVGLALGAPEFQRR